VLIGIPAEVAFAYQLERVDTLATTLTIADTIYPNGYILGQQVSITIFDVSPGFGSAYSETETAGLGANSGSGTAWTNPNNVTSPSSYATVHLASFVAVSQNLNATTFGFAVPSTVIALTTITVKLEAYTSLSAATAKLTLQLLKAGAPVGATQTVIVNVQNTPSAPQLVTLTFDGSAFAFTDANAGNFGVRIIGQEFEVPSASFDIFIRNVRITVEQAALVLPDFPQTYDATITQINSPTQFVFTVGIPVVLTSGTVLPVFAQITDASQANTLDSTVITNIFRLNQAQTNINGDRIVAIAGRIWRAALPAGNLFEEMVSITAPGGPVPTQTNGLSGRPLSIIAFRFTLDTVSWAIFADQLAMLKYRPGIDDSQIEFVPLGNAPPTVEASASAGGAGNLNSTGGTDYDWRYTYEDGYALTESNPSPIMLTPGATTTTRPTTFTNPALAGDSAFTSPTSAIDTSATTASVGSVVAESSAPGTLVTRQASCQWQGWSQPAGVVDSVSISVTAQVVVRVQKLNGIALAHGTLTYSYDGGVSWQTLVTANAGPLAPSKDTGKQTYTVTLPSSAAFSNFRVRAVSYASAHSLFTEESFAYASAVVSVFSISTTETVEATVNGLALVNKIGVICVTPSPYPQHTFIRLYRRGGSLPDAWRRVGTFQVSTLVQGACGAGTLEIDDNVSDTTLSTSDILELDNDQPVTSVNRKNQPLSFIWGPVGLDARVLGCGDPARPECVYFSKPGNADSWPPQNFVEVSSPGTPIIAGCVFNTRTFAFSRESIYELVEGLGGGTTFSPFRTPSAHGLFTPWGLAIGPMMFFIAKDGIYATEGGQEQSIVENDIKPLFPTYDTPGESVHDYEAVDFTRPDDMRLAYHNDELYFLYIGRDSGTRQELIYDLLKKRWRATDSTVGISDVYSEPNTISSLLLGTVGGVVYLAGGAHDPSELDVIENMNITTVVTVGVTLTAGAYFTRATRFTAAGEVAMSYEFGPLAIDPTHAIQVSFPGGPPDTVKWRVYYGLTSGLEDQYQEFTEASLVGSRVVVIIAAGTAGTLPTLNADNNISVAVRTGAHDQGAPLNQKQYGNVIFDLDPGGATVTAPVTITPLINGEVQTEAALTVTGIGRRQVPLDLSDFFAFNAEYEIAWTRTDVGGGIVSDPVIFQYDTLWFLEPVQVRHWQSQPTSFEFPGFVHCRDAYIAIRSTAPVTLTMTIDGVAVQTYTIPSTAGQRLKQYVQFDSNKGLMYQFSLDSEQEFRVYEPDIETRVKPWLGVLGYQPARVLGGEVNA